MRSVNKYMTMLKFFWSTPYLLLEESKKMLWILKAQHISNLFGIQTRS